MRAVEKPWTFFAVVLKYNWGKIFNLRENTFNNLPSNWSHHKSLKQLFYGASALTFRRALTLKEGIYTGTPRIRQAEKIMGNVFGLTRPPYYEGM